MLARGAPYAPRSLRRRKVEEITITQTQDQILSGSQYSSDVELVQLIQEKIIVIDQTKQNKDNIRRNHFKNVYNTVVWFPADRNSTSANISI
jgi:esterase/lipase superfamily enzyme